MPLARRYQVQPTKVRPRDFSPNTKNWHSQVPPKSEITNVASTSFPCSYRHTTQSWLISNGHELYDKQTIFRCSIPRRQSHELAKRHTNRVRRSHLEIECIVRVNESANQFQDDSNLRVCTHDTRRYEADIARSNRNGTFMNDAT